MQLDSIQADNFIGLNLFECDLTTATVHLFAGENEAGKSSVQEAIRFAMNGEVLRLGPKPKKSDLKLMIRNGAKSGAVSLDIMGIKITRDIKTGKLASGEEIQTPPYLPYVLNSQMFATKPHTERRDFLMGLTETSVIGEDIARRLRAKGVHEKCIERVIPLVRNGIKAAHAEAQERTRDSRSQWVGLTGNGPYGSQKAAGWVAKPPEDFDQARLDALEQLTAHNQEKIDQLNMDRGGLNTQIGVAKDKHPVACCECGAMLRITHENNPATGKMVMKSAAWDEKEDDVVQELTAKLMRVADEISKINSLQAEYTSELAAMKQKKFMLENSQDITERAQKLHRAVQEWDKCAEALAPDGIQAEILSDTLKPVNARLRETSISTGWPQVMIDPTMEILVEGQRYSLLSESARWRADAAIADAIAFLSGLKLLILDRMDVLSVSNRSRFLGWINKIKGQYDRILIFGTLKTAPKVPAGWASHWMESGEIKE